MPEPWRGGRRGEGRRSSWPPTPLDTIKPPLTNGNHGNLILEPSVVTNGIKPSNLILELTDPFSDKGLEEEDDVDSVILPTKVVIAPEGARYDGLSSNGKVHEFSFLDMFSSSHISVSLSSISYPTPSAYITSLPIIQSFPRHPTKILRIRLCLCFPSILAVSILSAISSSQTKSNIEEVVNTLMLDEGHSWQTGTNRIAGRMQHKLKMRMTHSSKIKNK